MAGGEGTRLRPLTNRRAKPAVPFGGQYRIIDFALSNFINSGLHSIYVLTQFKSQSLTEHLHEVWNFGSLLPNQFVVPVPAQMQTGQGWYQGTADAIYQNLNLVLEYRPNIVAVFGGDHVYRMDVNQMVNYHIERQAEATVAAIPVPIDEARQFGVIAVDRDWRIVGFEEKPEHPRPIPGEPSRALVSMGNYLFDRKVLAQVLKKDHSKDTSHDFGKDILPMMIEDGREIFVYDFRRNVVPGMRVGETNEYWRDVGTIDSYFEANMDLKAVEPQLNLYCDDWPLWTRAFNVPPAKFVHDSEGRVGRAINSIVCGGSILSGATVKESILGPYVRLHSYSEISCSILNEDVEVGRGAKIRNAIIDKHVRIPPESHVGYDLNEDRKRGYHVTESGIVVLGKWSKSLGIDATKVC